MTSWDARAKRICAVAIVAWVGTTASALAQVPPGNDNRQVPEGLEIPDIKDFNTTNATVQLGEPLTPGDPTRGCTPGGTAVPGEGVLMANTVWYTVVGNGRTLTLTTDPSRYDTVLAAYDWPVMVTCNDDIYFDEDPQIADFASEIRLKTLANAAYHIQLGGACTEDGCAFGTGFLSVYDQPANDSRAAAQPVATGVQLSTTNSGATEDNGEVLECALPGGTSDYGKTVWYRWTAPSTGTAVFQATASDVDTVLAVYRGGATTPIACNDDPTEAGPSRLQLAVAPGEYLIQVGGWGSGIDADDGDFVVSVDHSEDLDLDDDGAQRPPHGNDCNDGNAAIRPGAGDAPNNGVDENCDGRDEVDRDGDGALAPPGGNDCDDGNPARRPGLREVRGNDVDEDCNGVKEAFLSMRGRINARYEAPNRRYRRFDLLQLHIASPQAGTRIELRCRGRGCKFNRRQITVRRNVRRVGLKRFFRGGRLPMPATVEIRLTRPETMGKVRRLKIRRGKSVDDRLLCLRPGARRPHRCE